MIQTRRGFRDPRVRQVSVFLHNKVGELGDLLRHLDAEGVRVHAFAVTDSHDFAVMRFIADDIEKTRSTLTRLQLSNAESEVLAVEIPEPTSGLLQICRALLAAEINTHYTYSMISRPNGSPVIVLQPDDLELASEVLSKRGFALLSEADLFEDEDLPDSSAWT